MSYFVLYLCEVSNISYISHKLQVVVLLKLNSTLVPVNMHQGLRRLIHSRSCKLQRQVLLR